MIEFAGETYESIKAIQERLEAIRDMSPLRQPLQGTDHKMVLKLLQAHPRYKEKVGPGISALTVDFHPDFPQTRVFTIVRIDKRKEDFSFQKPWKKLQATLGKPAKTKQLSDPNEKTAAIGEVPKPDGLPEQRALSPEQAEWIAKLESRVTAAEQALAGVRKVIAEFKN